MQKDRGVSIDGRSNNCIFLFSCTCSITVIENNASVTLTRWRQKQIHIHRQGLFDFFFYWIDVHVSLQDKKKIPTHLEYTVQFLARANQINILILTKDLFRLLLDWSFHFCSFEDSRFCPCHSRFWYSGISKK